MSNGNTANSYTEKAEKQEKSDKSPVTLHNKLWSYYNTPSKGSKSNDKRLIELLSSGKLKNFSDKDRLNREESGIFFLDPISKLELSPNSNFLFQSPSSLEKYVDSFSRNVMRVYRPEPKIAVILDKENINLSNPMNKLPSSNSKKSCFKKLNSSPSPRLSDYSSVISTKIKDNSQDTTFNVVQTNLKCQKNLLDDLNNIGNNYSKLFNNQEKNLNLNLNHNNFNDLEICINKIMDISGKKMSKNENENISPSNQNIPVVNAHDQNNSNSPCKFTEKKTKRLFDCSDSKDSKNKTKEHSQNTSLNSENKRRMRKSHTQILDLKQMYHYNKDWSKEYISEVAKKTGLTESKVYKWFWDQKNKELFEKYKKKNRFYIQNSKSIN